MEGKPNQLYTQEMRSFEQYDEICEYFAERKQRDNARGVLPYQEVGGSWTLVQSSSPNKRKNLGSSVTTRHKNWERITILATFGVISEIQRANLGYLSPISLEAKFGALT